MEAAEFPDEVATVYIWADNDNNDRGEGAALSLAERLLEEGRSVFVAIPPREGQDWLDVLNQEGKEAVREGLDEAIEYVIEPVTAGISELPEDADPAHIVEELNKSHFVVNVGGRVCIANLQYDPQLNRMLLSFSSVSDFKLRYGNRFVNEDLTYSKLWLTSSERREYSGIVFLPGQNPAGFYNLFQGFAVEPQVGDCSLFWAHVRDHICAGNFVHFRYVRRWMAHAIQFPEQLPGTALVLRGLQGTGKGIFVDNFGALFGEHYLTIYRLDQVTGRFNSHLKNVLLLHANEATCRNDKVGEGVLKGLITDPFVPIEHKGKDIINLRNYKRIIVATNEDWAVPMGVDDRRYLVLDVDPAQKENKKYFQAIVNQMTNGGLAALMSDLLAEDLTDFDVRTVPFSASNFDQKLRSADPITQWWFNALMDGDTLLGRSSLCPGGWNCEPSHSELFQAYSAWCQEGRLPTLSKPLFGRTFRKLLPGAHVGERRRIAGGSESGIRMRFYLLPSLEVCRGAFQRYTKTGPEIWPNEEGS